ncbi:hypothetical protein [Arthrobacter sp. Marseille-P9274]|uniref:hypothetical protein n=1 Tax=Arthrobacter sp. Marseille-P9274 TaxID=2866572 RepID=UPI0021C6CA0A|nr:hypothetical protein [Arthrobacter sp. Marseille-P9274]
MDGKKGTRRTTFRAAMPRRYRVSLALFAAITMMAARLQLRENGVRISVAGLFSTEARYQDISDVAVGPATGLLLVSCARPEEFIECLDLARAGGGGTRD